MRRARRIVSLFLTAVFLLGLSLVPMLGLAMGERATTAATIHGPDCAGTMDEADAKPAGLCDACQICIFGAALLTEGPASNLRKVMLSTKEAPTSQLSGLVPPPEIPPPLR